MMLAVSDPLPIHLVRADFEAALARGAVVVSSPTGSGKSTELPRWAALARGRVLVVEPRRIACRSLAQRVAELEATDLGVGVGYVVRDDACLSDATRIVFATPGMVLADRGMTSRYDTIVLDEFHERSLDLDLLLALLRRDPKAPRIVVTSATLDGDRIATHLGGTHITAEGRAYPVSIEYADAGALLPRVDDLASRVRDAVMRVGATQGDVLVFLPGKAEIEAAARELRGSPFEVVTMHGGLTLDEQRRGFRRSDRKKVILATNVAETSLTIPGVGVVVDAGLVRRTRYHAGRGFLALAPIAEDSATQRTGRAGRTGPGACLRLWGRGARLESVTPPEIHRESLTPMVLKAAAWGSLFDELDFIDPPKPYAVDAARAELIGLGALADDGTLTAHGREIDGLPLDPPLARMLVQARGTDAVDDVVDLVAVLAVGRPLFSTRVADDEATIRAGSCDASALIRALRVAQDSEEGISPAVLSEARRNRTRLRKLLSLCGAAPRQDADRDALIRVALAADPRVAHVARTRGRQVAFSNGGTELELARESLVSRAKDLEAIIVFESRALGVGPDARVLVTCASPVSLGVLDRAGLGRDRLEAVRVERGSVVATVERVYARRVIGASEQTPVGEIARDAIATLFLRGSIFKAALASSKERLALSRIALGMGFGDEIDAGVRENPTLEGWSRARIDALGIESGDDIAMLSPADLTAPDVPYLVRLRLESDYPVSVSVGDATYAAEYDLEHKRVTLVLVRGQRKDPPPLSYLPKFPGLGIIVSSARGTTVLRARG